MKKVIALQGKLYQYRWKKNFSQMILLKLHLSTRGREPSTLQEALNNLDASFWKESMQEEIEALHKNKTWELVPLLGGRKPIGNKCVYKIKRNSDDQVERYRTRLVVKGHAQKERIEFNKKILCGSNDNNLSAFGNVPRCWYKRFDSFIRSLEYNKLHVDPCAYFKMFGNNNFNILLLYVDDMLVAGPNKDHINKLKAQLAREFEMKDLRPANKILGMQIHQDRVSRKIWLSQKSYVKKILQMFNMQDCKPISTPFPTDVKLSSKMSDLDGSKSTTWHVFTLSGGTVSWVSKLQSVVAMSAT
ncbi:retrovirus-related pol polyprotein from transposon TNT 1-94 [Tanacetum coccineum]